MMSDDQDGCEWVYVFLWYRPTRGSPGQRAVKRLCVCVFLSLICSSLLMRSILLTLFFMTAGDITVSTNS